MREIEVQHERNNIERKRIEDEFNAHQDSINGAIKLAGSNMNEIKTRKDEIGKFICAMNSGEDGNEILKKKYCK